MSTLLPSSSVHRHEASTARELDRKVIHRKNLSRRTLRVSAIALGITIILSGCGSDTVVPPAAFASGTLLVSRTAYAGIASTVVVGKTLFGGGVATNDGTFPNVFKNEVADPSFGVTSPIFLDNLTPAGALIRTITIDPAVMSSSFASKSELALNVSLDKTALTFMGYRSAVNQLDISNSNTAAVVDATNPVTVTGPRAVAQLNLNTADVTITSVNAYSGNNGRAAVLANGNYYMVGNAGNGNGDGNVLTALSNNTGVQMIAVGASGSTLPVGLAIGTLGSATGYQRGFSVGQVADPTTPGQNYPAGKTGKDGNFRGMTVFNKTLYVSKGSGSNGVNTVYQVGAISALANGGSLGGTSSITILPGFNTMSEKVAEAKATLTATPHPFGIWFADANTLFVADEGDGIRLGVSGKVTSFAGLQHYKLVAGVWSKIATYQGGLLDQAAYTASLPWTVKTDGLRNLTGVVNADGSYTLYATTATVSDEITHDLGGDPNQVVSITIAPSSLPSTTSFKIVQSALAGERLGGVALVP